MRANKCKVTVFSAPHREGGEDGDALEETLVQAPRALRGEGNDAVERAAVQRPQLDVRGVAVQVEFESKF